MKKLNILFLLAAMLLIASCSKKDPSEKFTDSLASNSVGFAASNTSGSNSPGNGNGHPDRSGQVTAGEWNDLENWDFWNSLGIKDDYQDDFHKWDFYTDNRISVLITQNNVPVYNAKVELKKGNSVVWTARTDNAGKAELWDGLFKQHNNIDLAPYSLEINDSKTVNSVLPYSQGINVIEISSDHYPSNKVELSFIVDATGSMGDELEFLKDDLQNVIKRVKSNEVVVNIFTSTVFYRDEGDEYVTKHSGFTNDLFSTIDFIKKQHAEDGGDYREAVHSALETGISKLQWSPRAKTRIAFLLLDAPPHFNPEIVDQMHELIMRYAEKGIKIIPIAASGINKETEFLMRHFAMATNGTYVFITDHSGIGNDHLEPTIGEYEVEYLNDLLVRLIIEYAG